MTHPYTTAEATTWELSHAALAAAARVAGLTALPGSNLVDGSPFDPGLLTQGRQELEAHGWYEHVDGTDLLQLDQPLSNVFAALTGAHESAGALHRIGESVVITVSGTDGAVLHEHSDGARLLHGSREQAVDSFSQQVAAAGYPDFALLATPPGEEPPVGQLPAATIDDGRWHALVEGGKLRRSDPLIVQRAARAAQRTGVSELTVLVVLEGGAIKGEQVAWTADDAGWVRIEATDIVAPDGAVELMFSPWPGAASAFDGLLDPLRQLSPSRSNL